MTANPITSEADRQWLLQIARDAVAAHLGRHTSSPPGSTEMLARRGAAFVTIRWRGELRGCIGHLEPDPIVGVVRQCAVAACSVDPRFPPLTPSELSDVLIELSLLGPFEPIAGADAIEIGRHGLIVERGQQRGLLLPQVAVEWGWDRQTFLAQTCRKAGLPADAWTKDATVRRFEAEVFGEPQEPAAR